MLTINCRAANDLDFKAVTKGRGSLGRNLAVALSFGAVVGGIAYAFSRSWGIAVMAGVGLFAISVYSNLMFFRKVRRYEALRTDSKAVEMFEVSADRILDVEPVGDNGPAFCFFVGGRKTLLLVGQWLLRYDSFPSKSFCLHLWSETRVPIRIDAIGPTVEPEHCDVQLRPTHRLRQLALFEASPETLQADLDNALGIARQGIGRS